MKAPSLKLSNRHALYSIVGAGILATSVFVAPHRERLPWHSPPVATPVAASHVQPFTARVDVPFNAGEVIDYFKEALGTKPTQMGGSTVFQTPANEPVETAYTITVSHEDRSVAVAFTGKGDYAMTLAREFFEAPFFTKEETARFFALLNASSVDQTEQLARFTLRFQVVTHKADFHVAMRFSPR